MTSRDEFERGALTCGPGQDAVSGTISEYRKTTVTVWYLEQLRHSELRPAKVPPTPVELVRVDLASPEFSRFLYTAVGADLFWIDRLPWTWKEWYDWLDRPGVETWVAWIRGTPAGYAELEAQPGGEVEVTHFGLLSPFLGQGIGGHLLSVALGQAWTIAARWPRRQPTRRVWTHTCSLDHPAALRNYQARGMRVHRTEIATVHLPLASPGSWPDSVIRQRRVGVRAETSDET